MIACFRSVLPCLLALNLMQCTQDSDLAPVALPPQMSPEPTKLTKEHCYKWPFDKPPPVFLKDQGVMVTSIQNSCVTPEGTAGYAADAGWMAMGFPCTKGQGRVEWKGFSTNPLMISFIIANSCPMAPQVMDQVKSLGVSNLGLNPSANLLAYYPFSVQYWELVEYDEADTGHVVEVRSSQAVSKAWANFKKGMPLKIRLFGRENTWIKGRGMYQVEAELVSTGRKTFMIKVLDAKPLDDGQVLTVRNRCESLRPARDCNGVFAF